MSRSESAAIDALAPLVGDWTMTASIGEPGTVGHASFEWGLGRQFLIQRMAVERSDIPESLAVIAVADEGQGFTQHYFDSRGVVRLYAMTLQDGVWTLLREQPDFSPFDFAQRFVGHLDDDADVIEGRWEQRPLDATGWEEDFRLTYRRTA